MDKKALAEFYLFQNNGRPRSPSRPFPPQSGSTAADHREYADKLEAFEKATEAYKVAINEYEQKRAKLHDAVTESMIAEYRNSGIKPEALSYILQHSLRETRTMEEAYDMYENIVMLFKDVDKLNKGEKVY